MNVNRFALSVVAISLLLACGSKRPSSSGALAVTLENGSAPFEISEEGHPYKGFRLNIPEGTFASASEWEFEVLSDAELPPLPQGYSLSGPGMRVATNQLRGEHLMTLEVPVNRGPGQAVVVALYDPTRQIFEILPTVAETDSSVRVVTAHLRPDLLVGTGVGSSSGGLRAVLSGLVTVAPISGYLLPLFQVRPTPEVAPVFDVATHRWPVVDHGSAAFPEGHSLSIAAFQALGAAMRSPKFTSLFQPLATPGFYSDAAPLAALILAQRELLAGVTGLTGELGASLAQVPKPERDELVHRNVVANLRLAGWPTPMAISQSLGLPPSFVNAVAGSEEKLTLLSPASSGTLELHRLPAGFENLSLLLTGDGAPTPMSEAMPLPSFIFPYEKITGLLRQLEKLTDKTLAKEANAQLAASAGLLDFKPELRINSTEEWVPEEEELVIRDDSSTLRINPAVMGFLLHGPAGSEVARSDGAPLPAALISGASKVLTEHRVSTFVKFGQTIRQASVKVVKLAKGPLKVSPETQVLASGSKEVSFEASFDFPPADGFRLKWEWGDGKTSEVLGLTNASHTYEALGDYDVKVTLLTAGTKVALGTARAKVEQGQQAIWRIDSFLDKDLLYQDNAQGDPFELLLVAPNAGIIAITETAAGSSLDLKVLDSGVWTSGVAPGTFTNVPLGKAPSVQEPLGPYFAEWATTHWSQSTTDLSTGTMTGQAIVGIETYVIDGAGQAGPGNGIRVSATRNGNTLTGTLYLAAWYVDADTFELEESNIFEFPFTATRL